MDVASINADFRNVGVRPRPGASADAGRPRAVSYDAEGNDVAGDVRPVTAYAPIDQRGPSELLSGRGLY